MFHLQTFGGLALRSDGAPLPASAAQRRRVALLAILASAGERGVTRDRLIGLLWPDNPADSARHALEQLVYATRRDLGRETLATVGGLVRLDPEKVCSDVDAFRWAVGKGAWEEAIALYHGPFLDGLYLDGSAEWERWAEAERGGFAQNYSHALQELARARETVGDTSGAVEAWRRLAGHDRFSSRVALHLMHALAAAGDRAAAIRHAEVHAVLLREELGLEPDAEITRVADELRRERPATPALPASAAPAPQTDPPPSPLPAVSSVATPSVSPEPPVPPRRRTPAPFAAVAILALMMVVVGWITWGRSALPAAASAGASASIAVLPFADMTPEADAEYFSDGMTEELIHALSQVDGLRVVARTSAFAFKGKNADVREIGDALGVGSVLEGSVRRAGDQVKITVQLIDTRSGYHLWSAMYERQMADILMVQEEISRAVVGALRPALLRGVSGPLLSRATANPDAYQLYMQGRFFWNQRTEEGLRSAVDRFERAVLLDAGYAAAYTGLSDAHNSLADNGYVPSGPALEKAEAAVRKALELDGELAEAHSSRGHLKLHRWDWAGAERDFRRAIELNPNYAIAYQYYAFLLTFQGRFSEALPLIRRAQHLDPLSLAIQSNVGEILYLARRYPDAAEQLRFVLQMDSTRLDTRWMLGSTLAEMEQYDEAIAELRRVIDMGGGWHRSAVATLGYVYVRAGRFAEAEAVRRELEHGRSEGRVVTPYHYAVLLGALGGRDEAFALLDEALATSQSSLGTVGISPRMDPLRSDPRYALLLRRVGLPTPDR